MSKKKKRKRDGQSASQPGISKFSLHGLKDGLQLTGDGKWTLFLIGLSAALFAFLSINHTFIPMWVEGIAEYHTVLLVMLGFIDTTPSCWINVSSLHLPLALNGYIGPAFFYFHAPPAYLWFNGYTDDPYVYRYMGIILFLVDGWLLFYLLRKFYSPDIAFYGAAAFMTGPTLLILLGEGGSYYLVLFLVFGAAAAFVYYIKGGGVWALFLSAFALGITLTTRVEVFVWLIVPFAIYLALSRPPVILDRWKATSKKLLVVVGLGAGFFLGALPTVIYNVLCPSNALLSVLTSSIIPSSFGTTAIPLSSKLLVRLGQFWSGNLLNETEGAPGVSNYVLMLVFLICVGVTVVRAIKYREVSFFLTAIVTSLLLSLITRGILRSEHLLIIQPAVLMVVVSALAFLRKYPSLRRAVHVTFLLLILGNVVTTALIWRKWNNHPDNVQTMLNQSDPVLLVNHLSRNHSQDHILYTNIGMVAYVRYLTVDRLKGEDIMSWYGSDGFVNGVKLALLDTTRRRVFVAVGKERDGAPGTLPRTNLLYSILKQYNIPYTVVPLPNNRNRYLYELVVVEKGIGMAREFLNKKDILVSSVVDVRVQPQPSGGNLIIGSILGNGFMIGDALIINGKMSFPTVFGNDTWITFGIPQESLEKADSFTLELLRPGTLQRSEPHVVKVGQQ